MIRYLIDSSALWRIQRDKLLREAWAEVISNGTVGSCQAERTEFKSSARNHMEYEVMSDMFAELYADVAVPKSAWQWVEATQYRLARNGGHQGLSVVDLLISATAAHHGLIVLHDDNDFATVARNVQDLRERNVNAAPS